MSEVQGGVVPSTWWTYSDAGHNGEAKNEVRALSNGSEELFITPKPEKLLSRILQIATSPGDLVLDSFAGSGTTGAVAHKMGRRWIMVELGKHCHTHIIPRLQKVIDGEDQGGISKAVNWQGGGGFRYYSLAPSLIVNDRWGNVLLEAMERSDYRILLEHINAATPGDVAGIDVLLFSQVISTARRQVEWLLRTSSAEEL